MTEHTILSVAGMGCPSCIVHIRDALGAIAGVRTVDVQLERGLVVVEHDPQRAPTRALIAALEHEGYPTAQPAL